MGGWIIPDAVISGYGRVQALRYRCLRCGEFYFPSYDQEVVCVSCFAKDSVLDGRKTGPEGTINIIGWEQKTGCSKYSRSYVNYNKVFKRDRYTCQYCGYEIHLPDVQQLSIDHIYPFSRRGSNRMDNLVCACMSCNSLASDKLFKNFVYKKWYVLDVRKEKGLPVYRTDLNPFPELEHVMGLV